MQSMACVTLFVFLSAGSVFQTQRNIWEKQYRDRAAIDMAAQFESDARPVYRHRSDILELLELKRGESVAEVGAGSGFLSRLAAVAVGTTGRVVATELDRKMVDYMNARAKAEGLSNFTAILGDTTTSGLRPHSTDAIVVVNTFSFFDEPAAMMRSIVAAIKPGGRLLIVDILASGGEGIRPEAVTELAAANGLKQVASSSVVPSHFALLFKKMPTTPNSTAPFTAGAAIIIG